ncbi:serine hydrolase [Streptococcus equi subsp. equi]|uniref:serine hydrolase n=1 Tax=Streptococcus equi TaxID=1336 RepID=UPI001E602855|nr:serine hydrolase [Streptococcus equi]MCD3501473.1 serine hydrolase [Streptococcus equi subsp. equi]
MPKRAQQKAPIASLTKLLTVYLVLKEIKAGRLQWDSQVTLSEYALQLATDPDISNPAFEQRPYTIKELVESSLIISANSSGAAAQQSISLAQSLHCRHDEKNSWRLGGLETIFLSMLQG